MRMLKDVFAEIGGMFVGDARLSLAIVAMVALAAALVAVPALDPLIAGAQLLIGCILVLVNAVCRSSRDTPGPSHEAAHSAARNVRPRGAS